MMRVDSLEFPTVLVEVDGTLYAPYNVVWVDDGWDLFFAINRSIHGYRVWAGPTVESYSEVLEQAPNTSISVVVRVKLT